MVIMMFLSFVSFFVLNYHMFTMFVLIHEICLFLLRAI